MLVSICIATYKRPDQLKCLLEGLNRLTFGKIEIPDIELIIVDNDFSGSAQQLCEEFEAKFAGRLRYDIEIEKGVTYARNRTIKNISQDSDFIAIMDDDEVPDPSWLEELLAVQSQYNADIVTGPVIPQFEDKSTPDWVTKGKFFEPLSQATGSPMNVAFTNNVLVRSKILQQLDPVFDNRLASKAAEDTHLFMRLYKSGYRIVWANEAIVREWIPESRTNVKWLMERAYWGWSSYSLFERELYPSVKVQAVRLIKGCGLIAVGILRSVPAMLQGKHSFVQELLNIYRGLGTLSGVFGIQGKW
ncbi:MAG: glycosyltransferase family 2 protein [Oscillatoriales cyanobacterium RM1_1_9]|nr:glycosyltransferase family 2 protein [Oscillatoriales cyanobacterium SM2_3_0]NJO44414.1 glycosyltransferase family 2 protein [Oscillatoriales cyanobacterium RM2_1_1]NJO71046.1 glycosyltransferase family 2 protein [Oscillatoriales cyanobacterium RM1_1_9]